MRHFIAVAAILLAPFALTGCGTETKIKETKTVETPKGTTTTTVETKVEKTGDHVDPKNK